MIHIKHKTTSKITTHACEFLQLSENIRNENELATQAESDAFDLQKAKDARVQELESYHYNSQDLRTMTINSHFVLSLTQEGRNIIAEQIRDLKMQIELGLIAEEEAVFSYSYKGAAADITMEQLKALYIKMMQIVNANFKVFEDHKTAIGLLTTPTKVKNYDFNANYLKNQNLDI